jgi:hypothetical protein
MTVKQFYHVCWKAATVLYSRCAELYVFRKRFNIISTRVEQVLVNRNLFKLFQIPNYDGLYKEGKVIICVTTKLETFPLLYHLCKLLTLLVFYFIFKLNNVT